MNVCVTACSSALNSLCECDYSQPRSYDDVTFLRTLDPATLIDIARDDIGMSEDDAVVFKKAIQGA